MEDVHFRCGCTVEVRLPRDERARTAMRAHMQTQPCRECGYQEKVRAAQQRAVELGLVPLQGTPRQVAYSSYLRGLQVDLFLRQIDPVKWPDEKRWEQLYRKLLSTVNELPSTWWLEHQELRSLQLLLGDGWNEER